MYSCIPPTPINFILDHVNSVKNGRKSKVSWTNNILTLRAIEKNRFFLILKDHMMGIRGLSKAIRQ